MILRPSQNPFRRPAATSRVTRSPGALSGRNDEKSLASRADHDGKAPDILILKAEIEVCPFMGREGRPGCLLSLEKGCPKRSPGPDALNAIGRKHRTASTARSGNAASVCLPLRAAPRRLPARVIRSAGPVPIRASRPARPQAPARSAPSEAPRARSRRPRPPRAPGTRQQSPPRPWRPGP